MEIENEKKIIDENKIEKGIEKEDEFDYLGLLNSIVEEAQKSDISELEKIEKKIKVWSCIIVG